MSSTMFSSMDSEKSRTTGHCTMQAQIWPAEPSPTAVCGVTTIHLRDVILHFIVFTAAIPRNLMHNP